MALKILSGGVLTLGRGGGLQIAGNNDFDPADYGTVMGWYKADAITGKNDGDTITTWEDSSAANNDLTQATDTKRPLYKTAIQNGLPVVRFDGAGDFLQKVFTFAQPAHIIVVGTYRTGYSSNAVIFDGGVAGTIHGALFRTSSTVMSLYAGSTSCALTTTPQAWHCYASLFSNAASENRADGGAAATGTAGSGPLGGITLGADAAGAQSGAVDIGEVIAFSTTLSAGSRQAIEAAMKEKWATP
jgi:hypothetical protein